MATGSIGEFSILSPSQKKKLERKRQEEEARKAVEAAKKAEAARKARIAREESEAKRRAEIESQARKARIAREESEAKRRAEIESQISQIEGLRTAKITAWIISGIAVLVGIIWLVFMFLEVFGYYNGLQLMGGIVVIAALIVGWGIIKENIDDIKANSDHKIESLKKEL